MLYSALTPSQQEQAQHDLFHDAVFNVDSHQFDYLVEAGRVIGRIPHTMETNRKQIRNQPTIIASTVAIIVEVETQYRINCAINDLARLVAIKLVNEESVYANC